MYPCHDCGHHHCIKDGPTLPCNGLTYQDDGGIARCKCHHHRTEPSSMRKCEAQHREAKGGHCEGHEGHSGNHFAFHRIPPGYKFHWPNEAELDKPNLHLTSVDLGILLTALEPVKQFFPELERKLQAARTETARV